jgi:hypothetical protein
MQTIFWLDLKASFRHCYLVRAQPKTGKRSPKQETLTVEVEKI